MSTPHVETVKLDELNCWRIRHGQAELLIAQQGAQILSYQVAGEPPIIWLNDQAQFKHEQNIRAGVPVCWPWFGVFQRNPESVQAMRQSNEAATAHGFVRTREWTLLGIQAQDDGVLAEFALPLPEAGFAGWPHKVGLKLSVHLGEQLQIRLTSENLDDHRVTLSQALHTYFAVSDVRNVHVEGVDGLTYIDTADEWKHVQQNGPLRFSSETDRIYLDTPAQLNLVDPTWERRIELTTEGSRSAVIWNPWIDRASQLADMADDGWQKMLCIETANVMDDVVTLAPGASHALSVTIGSRRLA
ncbi:glucose-6-phosphate 1-epimerase [Pseudomonas asplenii]|uniref:Putative glucose-6-phosphate 1-epimerase n=1 Tax=Pseudomonas asplenii TaxID=53407 RepID=A0A1H1S5H5_9PSED|nr:D-hexose-6-phosphate mutarotase [Pseudomonas asplenii]SDS43214.1 glucose-6-phosphate 1-epimerase [Pseudomonas asplenii]